MKFPERLFVVSRTYFMVALVTVLSLFCQESSTPLSHAVSANAAGLPQPMNWTAAEDHQNMMAQLGIRKLRPGPSGNESAPNHANYDEATANPFPSLPEFLTLKNGTKVTSADLWWKQRRTEIVEDFDREVLGRVPKNVPKVTWTVTSALRGMAGSYPVVSKQIVGHVDNSSFPSISVEIQMTLVTPADARMPVPVMMMFGSGAAATQQLIADGWGYVSINPGSIQADNGTGLTKG